MLTPIFGANGILQYLSKLHFILQNACGVNYHLPQVSKSSGLSRSNQTRTGTCVPCKYTTINFELQQEENLVAVLKTRTKKACPMPLEHGQVNWNGTPRDPTGFPVRFPWNLSAFKKNATETICLVTLTPIMNEKHSHSNRVLAGSNRV